MKCDNWQPTGTDTQLASLAKVDAIATAVPTI